MINPYDVLNINEYATDEEIKKALRNQINTYGDDSKNDRFLQIFFEAANMLLDKESREQVDLELSRNRKKDNFLAPTICETINYSHYEEYLPNELPKNLVTTYINNKYFNITLTLKKESLFKKLFNRVDASEIYGLFSNDNSFMLAYEKNYPNKGIYDNTFDSCLCSLFTNQILTEKFSFYDFPGFPWDNNKFFNSIDGKVIYAIPYSDIIPRELINNKGKVSKEILQKLATNIQYHLTKNPDITDKIFENYIEPKEMKKIIQFKNIRRKG